MTKAQIRRRFQKALDALQAQSSAATSMLDDKIAQRPQNRTPLKSAQQRMVEYQSETGRIWNFVVSGAARKTLPELTLADLEPLIDNTPQ